MSPIEGVGDGPAVWLDPLPEPDDPTGVMFVDDAFSAFSGTTGVDESPRWEG